MRVVAGLGAERSTPGRTRGQVPMQVYMEALNLEESSRSDRTEMANDLLPTTDSTACGGCGCQEKRALSTYPISHQKTRECVALAVLNPHTPAATLSCRRLPAICRLLHCERTLVLRACSRRIAPPPARLVCVKLRHPHESICAFGRGRVASWKRPLLWRASPGRDLRSAPEVPAHSGICSRDHSPNVHTTALTADFADTAVYAVSNIRAMIV